MAVVITVATALLRPHDVYEGIGVGLLTLVTGIGWETRHLLTRRFDAEDRRARLMQAIENSILPEESILQLVEAAARVPDIALLRERAQELVDGCRHGLEEAVRFRRHEHGYDVDVLSRLIHDAQESIRAVSTIVDLEFWLSDDGDTYIKQQEAAADVGRLVQRVFIVDFDYHPPSIDKISAIVETQRERGIEVRWTNKHALDAQDDYDDYVIIDDSVLIQTRANLDHVATGMVVDFDPAASTAKLESFYRVWKDASAAPMARPIF